MTRFVFILLIVIEAKLDASKVSPGLKISSSVVQGAGRYRFISFESSSIVTRQPAWRIVYEYVGPKNIDAESGK